MLYLTEIGYVQIHCHGRIEETPDDRVGVSSGICISMDSRETGCRNSEAMKYLFIRYHQICLIHGFQGLQYHLLRSSWKLASIAKLMDGRRLNK